MSNCDAGLDECEQECDPMRDFDAGLDECEQESDPMSGCDAGLDECEQERDPLGGCAWPQACLCDCGGHSQYHPSPGSAQRL